MGDVGAHFLSDGSRVRISQVADDKIVSWRERCVHACELFSRSERDSDARGHWSVLVENSLRSIAEDPELIESQGDRDGQECELDARLLVPLDSSTNRRFHKLVRINKHSPDIASGVHVGKDDLGVGAGDQGILFGCADDETGKTEMRILMIGLDATGKTTIHC